MIDRIAKLPVGVAIAAADRKLLPEGRIDGPMPWVIAIMMLLTVLAAAAGLGLGGAAHGLGVALAGRLTVQIVEANPDRRAAQRSAVIAELSRLGGVETVDAVDDAAMRKLLAPWLGRDGLDSDLPVPALIDVTLAQDARRTPDSIEAIVRQVAPSARVERHADWLGPLAGLLTTLQLLSVALVALMAVAMTASVVLAARAALDTHRATIDVMHLMGATDLQIARLFERRVALDAAFGAALGFVGGVAILLLVAAQLDAIGAALFEAGGLGWIGWAAIGAIPLLGVILAVLTARFTVLRVLARIL